MTTIAPPRPAQRRYVATVLVLGAVAAVAGQYAVRVIEARAGAWLGDLLVPGVGRVRPAGGTQFTIWSGSGQARAIDVASVCTIAPYIAAVLLVAAAFVLWDRRVAPVRVGRVAGCVCVLFLGVNIIRIVVIVASVGALGIPDGLELGHKVLGTLLVLAALITGIALLARVILTPGQSGSAASPRETRHKGRRASTARRGAR